MNQSSTHIGASQTTLKTGETGTGKNLLANQQPVAPPVEEEVARIRLKITAKATYSKYDLSF
jgi:hypothetical protein